MEAKTPQAKSKTIIKKEKNTSKKPLNQTYDSNYSTNFDTNDDNYNVPEKKNESQTKQEIKIPPGQKGKKPRVRIMRSSSKLDEELPKNAKVIKLNIKPLKNLIQKMEKKRNNYFCFTKWKNFRGNSSSKEKKQEKEIEKKTVTVKKSTKKLKLNLPKKPNIEIPKTPNNQQKPEKKADNEKDNKKTELTNKDKIKEPSKKDSKVTEEKPSQEELKDVCDNIVNVLNKGNKMERRASKNLLLDILNNIDGNIDNQKDEQKNDKKTYGDKTRKPPRKIKKIKIIRNKKPPIDNGDNKEIKDNKDNKDDNTIVIEEDKDMGKIYNSLVNILSKGDNEQRRQSKNTIIDIVNSIKDNKDED